MRASVQMMWAVYNALRNKNTFKLRLVPVRTNFLVNYQDLRSGHSSSSSQTQYKNKNLGKTKKAKSPMVTQHFFFCLKFIRFFVKMRRGMWCFHWARVISVYSDTKAKSVKLIPNFIIIWYSFILFYFLNKYFCAVPTPTSRQLNARNWKHTHEFIFPPWNTWYALLS